jgi:hypothetical protein
LWSFSTTVAGVPLGKTKAYQTLVSKLTSPCSCAEATFGSVGERLFVRIAIAFTELLWICGIASSAPPAPHLDDIELAGIRHRGE